jgi:hypothetical protein
VAGAKKYKYNTKYNANTYNTKYTPPYGVFSFPDHISNCDIGAYIGMQQEQWSNVEQFVEVLRGTFSPIYIPIYTIAYTYTRPQL